MDGKAEGRLVGVSGGGSHVGPRGWPWLGISFGEYWTSAYLSGRLCKSGKVDRLGSAGSRSLCSLIFSLTLMAHMAEYVDVAVAAPLPIRVGAAYSIGMSFAARRLFDSMLSCSCIADVRGS